MEPIRDDGRVPSPDGSQKAEMRTGNQFARGVELETQVRTYRTTPDGRCDLVCRWGWKSVEQEERFGLQLVGDGNAGAWQ